MLKSLESKLRKTYAKFVKRDKKAVSCYEYIEAGGEKLRVQYPLEQDSVVLDVGGYLGDFAEELIARYNCSVDIFEPVKRYYDVISKKFKNNKKVFAFNYGLGATDTVEYISIDGLASSVYETKNTSSKREKIHIRSIIDYLEEKKYQKIDLLKINIEGGEYPLLLALTKRPDLMKNIRFIQIQFHDFIDNADQMRSQIQEQLSATHIQMWDFPFIWESWELVSD